MMPMIAMMHNLPTYKNGWVIAVVQAGRKAEGLYTETLANLSVLYPSNSHIILVFLSCCYHAPVNRFRQQQENKQ